MWTATSDGNKIWKLFAAYSKLNKSHQSRSLRQNDAKMRYMCKRLVCSRLAIKSVHWKKQKAWAWWMTKPMTAAHYRHPHWLPPSEFNSHCLRGRTSRSFAFGVNANRDNVAGRRDLLTALKKLDNKKACHGIKKECFIWKIICALVCFSTGRSWQFH